MSRPITEAMYTEYYRTPAPIRYRSRWVMDAKTLNAARLENSDNFLVVPVGRVTSIIGLPVHLNSKMRGFRLELQPRVTPKRRGPLCPIR